MASWSVGTPYQLGCQLPILRGPTGRACGPFECKENLFAQTKLKNFVRLCDGLNGGGADFG